MLSNDPDAIERLERLQAVNYEEISCSDDDFAEDDEPGENMNEWTLAKRDHNLVSKSMDELMALTGLHEIKKKAMGIVKAVLLQKERPQTVKADTPMNFLFTGNPGCGKTTVARKIAHAMSELGFRTNPSPVETSAQDILKQDNPAKDFQDMLESATGGTLFIDEAYRFSPARQGQQPNASNQVLDSLLEFIDRPDTSKSTSIILAGYRDELQDLLTYSAGFASRFPLDFVFPDYNQAQLRKIFVSMVKDDARTFPYTASFTEILARGRQPWHSYTEGS